MPNFQQTGAALADPQQNPPPQATPQPGPDDSGGAPSDLASQWSQWVGKPQNRAALAQFGIAMLQPVQQGETATSHFANAVGSGGEAAESVAKQGLAEKTVEDTSQLKAAQAELAGTRASLAPQIAASQQQTAEARTEAAGARGEAAITRAQMQGEYTKSLRDIQTSNAYQNYVTQTNKTNSDPLNTNPQPIMDMQTWKQSQGLAPPAGQDIKAPMTPGQGTKPPLNSLIQKDPQKWAQIKARASAGDPKALQALDVLRNGVSDPQMVDKMLKEP
jgi:hypothetical protein